MSSPVAVPRTSLPTHEGLTVEFKRDAPQPAGLSDNDLVAAAVCLANTEGGDLYLGIADDGGVQGIVPSRDVDRVGAVIANRTTPRVVANVQLLDVDGIPVIHVQVPRMPTPVMRGDGLYQRRLVKGDGTPECVAMQPHEVTMRGGDSSRRDPSAEIVPGADVADLDPVERTRLRQVIDEQPNADKRLLELGDEEFDDALGIVREADGRRVPTLTGLLLLGTERALRRLVPQHEVALQVFRGTEVTLNRIGNSPLLAALDDLNRQFATLPAEGELAVGLRRLAIPSVDADAFREGVLNAFAHRDYGRHGKVRVAFREDELEVFSPGGLVPGISVDRLLTAPPLHRNAALVNALTRIGLVEQSARGVDRIYEGQVRYGRPLPDYRDTTSEFVLVRLSRAPADRPFYAAVLAMERLLASEASSGTPARRTRLPVEHILVLAALRRERRLTMTELAEALQRPEDGARAILVEMERRGLVAPHGQTRARFYVTGRRFLELLRSDDMAAAAAGLPPLAQQEARVVAHARSHGEVRRADVMRLLPLTEEQASELLVRLVRAGRLLRRGVGRGTYYELGAVEEFEVVSDSSSSP